MVEIVADSSYLDFNLEDEIARIQEDEIVTNV